MKAIHHTMPHMWTISQKIPSHQSNHLKVKERHIEMSTIYYSETGVAKFVKTFLHSDDDSTIFYVLLQKVFILSWDANSIFFKWDKMGRQCQRTDAEETCRRVAKCVTVRHTFTLAYSRSRFCNALQNYVPLITRQQLKLYGILLYA